MSQFRGILENDVYYNEFLILYNKYRAENNIDSWTDIDDIKNFISQLDMSKSKMKNFYESIKYAIMYDVVPIKGDLQEKLKSPNKTIPSKWPAYLKTLSEKFVNALDNLPQDILENFRNSKAGGVSRNIINITFSMVHPNRVMTISLFDRLRCIAFHHFLRFHYGNLKNVKIPRMVSWGETNTIKWLEKQKVQLKKEHQEIVSRARDNRNLMMKYKNKKSSDSSETDDEPAIKRPSPALKKTTVFKRSRSAEKTGQSSSLNSKHSKKSKLALDNPSTSAQCPTTSASSGETSHQQNKDSEIVMCCCRRRCRSNVVRSQHCKDNKNYVKLAEKWISLEHHKQQNAETGDAEGTTLDAESYDAFLRDRILRTSTPTESMDQDNSSDDQDSSSSTESIRTRLEKVRKKRERENSTRNKNKKPKKNLSKTDKRGMANSLSGNKKRSTFRVSSRHEMGKKKSVNSVRLNYELNDRNPVILLTDVGINPINRNNSDENTGKKQETSLEQNAEVERLGSSEKDSENQDNSLEERNDLHSTTIHEETVLQTAEINDINGISMHLLCNKPGKLLQPSMLDVQATIDVETYVVEETESLGASERAEINNDKNAEQAAKEEAELAAKLAEEAEKEAAKHAAELAEKEAAKHAAELSAKKAAELAAKLAEEEAEKEAAELSAKAAAELAEKAAAELAATEAAELAAKLAEKEGEKEAAKHAAELAEKEVAKHAAELSAEKPAELAAKEAAKLAEKEAAKHAEKAAAELAIKKKTEQDAKEAVDNEVNNDQPGASSTEGISSARKFIRPSGQQGSAKNALEPSDSEETKEQQVIATRLVFGRKAKTLALKALRKK